MSAVYFFLISQIGGKFYLGRLADLFQIDAIIALLVCILIFEIKRWRRLKDLDNGR